MNSREEDFWDEDQHVVISDIDESAVSHPWFPRRFMEPRSLFSLVKMVVAAALLLAMLAYWLQEPRSTSTAPLKGTILFTYHDQRGVDDSMWLPDSRHLVFIDQSNEVFLWNAATRKVTNLFTLPPLYYNFIQVGDWMWAPDHIHLIFATPAGTVQVRNIMTGQAALVYNTHSNGWPVMAESPDGNSFAVSDTAGTVQVWNIMTGKKRLTLTSKQGLLISEVAFSPNNRYLATVSANRTIEVWDSTSGNELQSLDDTANQSQSIEQYHAKLSIVWAPDSRSIAAIKNVLTGEGNSIVIWNALTGHKLLTFSKNTKGVFTLQWSPDSTRILSASVNEVLVWSTATGRTMLSVPASGSPGNLPLLSPDGKLLENEKTPTTLEIWNAITDQRLFTYQLKSTSLEGDVISWSPNDTFIASANSDGSVLVWNARTGNPMYKYSIDANPAQTLNWSPDGRMISTTSSDGTVAILQI